jgi:hypothetical protein
MFQMFLPFGPERTRLARPEQCHFAGANLKPAGGPFLDTDRRFAMSPRFSVLQGTGQGKHHGPAVLQSMYVQVPWGSGNARQDLLQPDQAQCQSGDDPGKHLSQVRPSSSWFAFLFPAFFEVRTGKHGNGICSRAVLFVQPYQCRCCPASLVIP